MLALEKIRPNPQQPRRRFAESSLAQLADSLKTHGAIQPVLVRAAGNGFELVAGERRWRAAKLAGLAEIPAIVRPVADGDLLEQALIENLHREDLNPVERGEAYLSLKQHLNIDNDEISRRLGLDRATVANYMRLLDLPSAVLEMVADGRLSMGHARALLGLAEAAVATKTAARIVAEGWSVRQTERFVQAAGTTRAAAAAPPKRPAVADMERRLGEALATKVRVVEGRRRGTGRVVIEYYSLDEFERIASRLGLESEA